MPAAMATLANQAARRIADFVERTPLRHSAVFSERLGAEVRFKLENRQVTGSFKLRGASNRLLALGDEQRARGCVAASSGNHGAAVACAMQRLGVRGVIFVPKRTSRAKVAKIEHYGGTVRYFGSDGLDTEQHARTYARQHGMFYLSPYNDEEVIAGQGTIGIEILEDLPDVDAVFVAVGGGGLVGGIGSVLKHHDERIRVVGCQPLASPVMARSVAAGQILELPSEATLSDGTAGGIEPDAVTFPLSRRVVDEWVEVSEPQIARAMRDFMRSEQDVIEGAAGVAVAALLQRRAAVAGKKVVVVICGGNIADTVLDELEGLELDGGLPVPDTEQERNA
jgi:threonine dehydratase